MNQDITMSKEEYRLSIENCQLKKKLQRIVAEKEQLEREYRECDHYYPIYAVQRLEQVCAFCGKKTDLFHDGICPECYGFD